ncbi:MAG: hypothetical protein ACPGSM_16760 [Thiolinea sp.]
MPETFIQWDLPAEIYCHAAYYHTIESAGQRLQEQELIATVRFDLVCMGVND